MIPNSEHMTRTIRFLRAVAYYGANCGFEWEDGPESGALEMLLNTLKWDNERLAEFGLTSCEDFLYGDDDGGFWLVADEATFAVTVAQCQAQDESGKHRWTLLSKEYTKAEAERAGFELVSW